MEDTSRVRAELAVAVAGSTRGVDVADRLCGACVELLLVDGAALSVIQEGAISRSFGASSALSRELDELQFTFGEGPCFDAVRGGGPVLVPDLAESSSRPWPAFAPAALDRGVRSVFALPVTIANIAIGALDLYRHEPAALDGKGLAGGLVAAEFAALPLLDLLGNDFDAAVNDEHSPAWNELTALTRVEVYQAAGVLIAQLGVTPAEALVRLRAYAFAHDRTASEVAFDIIERRLRLDDDDRTPGRAREHGDPGEVDGSDVR